MLSSRPGTAYPLGPTVVASEKRADGSVRLTVNLAVFALVERLSVCVFRPRAAGSPVTRDVLAEVRFAARTGCVWHVELSGVPPRAAYALRVAEGHAAARLLCDPYARWLESPGAHMWMTLEGERAGEPTPADQLRSVRDFIASFPSLRRMGIRHPFRACLFAPPPSAAAFDWGADEPPLIPYHDTVIYEAHVRALTPRGTFAAAVDVIPYLKRLGVTSLQLMPVFEFSELEMDPLDGDFVLLRDGSVPPSQRRGNLWGYSPMSWFSPMNRYASADASGGAVELKTLIKALHAEHIECILDVVYNHSANASCPFHFLNVQKYYYIGKDEDSGFRHSNISGCGNTLSPNSPLMLNLIMESLRWFVTEYHIDGFRIDAAGVLCRDEQGTPITSPSIMDHIACDPILHNVKLIVEGWDAGDQIGSPNMLLTSEHGFPRGERVCEWNVEWRDSVRKFFKGDKQTGLDRAFCQSIRGSPHIFGDGESVTESRPYGSCHSINFVACHDGFCLADVVSYKERVNSDGYDEVSFNCGEEGKTSKEAVGALRAKQMRNFVLTLAISRGIPMITQGDEFGFSKGGNSNTWNDPSCFVFRLPEKPWECSHCEGLVQFTGHMLKLRRSFSQLSGKDFYQELKWLDIRGKQVVSERSSKSRYRVSGYVALVTGENREGEFVFVAFNNTKRSLVGTLPYPIEQVAWLEVINTSSTRWMTNKSVAEEDDSKVAIESHSSVLYVGKRRVFPVK